jgi:hypothetical protein
VKKEKEERVRKENEKRRRTWYKKTSTKEARTPMQGLESKQRKVPSKEEWRGWRQNPDKKVTE